MFFFFGSVLRAAPGGQSTPDRSQDGGLLGRAALRGPSRDRFEGSVRRVASICPFFRASFKDAPKKNRVPTPKSLMCRGVTSMSVRSRDPIFFSENHQDSQGTGWFSERTMVEKNGESFSRTSVTFLGLDLFGGGQKVWTLFITNPIWN